MTPAPRIKDVAERAGVSPTLASFALNGRAGVSARTRKRILAAAAELGYSGNPHARALRTGYGSAFALLIRNLSNPMFLDVIAGAQEAVAGTDATIVVANSDYDFERESKNIRQLAAQRVGGLAITPVGPGESLELWREICPTTPTVLLFSVAPGMSDLIRIAPDNEAAVRLVVDHLHDLGHREILFLSAPTELMADPDRLVAFEQRCAELGVVPRVLGAQLNVDSIIREIRALLLSDSPPTAVMTNSDYTAHAVYLAARECGVRVGQDLSVVGHDDLSTASLLWPPLTTIKLDVRSIGAAIIPRLRGTETSDHIEPVELIIRDSAAPPPHRR